MEGSYSTKIGSTIQKWTATEASYLPWACINTRGMAPKESKKIKRMTTFSPQKKNINQNKNRIQTSLTKHFLGTKWTKILSTQLKSTMNQNYAYQTSVNPNQKKLIKMNLNANTNLASIPSLFLLIWSLKSWPVVLLRISWIANCLQRRRFLGMRKF